MIFVLMLKIVHLKKTIEMQKKELRILVDEYNGLPELTERDRDLVLAARKASGNAYSPYSGFKVGAALLLENGVVLTGNNQENADYTDGLCAERVALFYANANYPEVPVVVMAVTAFNTKGNLVELAKPCGSCRQVLVETESRYATKIRLILDGKDKIQVIEGVENLLPLAFKPDELG